MDPNLLKGCKEIMGLAAKQRMYLAVILSSPSLPLHCFSDTDADQRDLKSELITNILRRTAL